MKRRVNGKSRIGEILRSNGVYVTIAVALLAVGGLGVSRILSETEKQPIAKQPEHEMVEQIVTDAPDERTTTATTQEKTTTATTAEEEEAPDLYVLPLSNTVQKPFSIEAPLYSETMKSWRLHLGTDFAGEQEQEVKALARGTVSKVEEDALWGNVIEIDHGVGVVSRYCGVKPSVKEGDEVRAGNGIGTLSEIPCEALQAPHLHLEMRIDGTPVDPVEAIALEVRYADTLTEEETVE